MTTGRINQVARDEILTTPNKAWRRHESRHGNEETETSHSSRPKRSESEKGGHEMSRDRPKVPSQRVQRHRRHKARSADATRPLQERRIALLKGEGARVDGGNSKHHTPRRRPHKETPSLGVRSASKQPRAIHRTRQGDETRRTHAWNKTWSR